MSYLFLLLIEVVDDDTDEEVQGEEGAEDDEDDKVDVHVYIVLVHRLVFHLCGEKVITDCNNVLVWCFKWPRTNLSRINSCVHDVHPTLECGLFSRDMLTM